VLPLVLLATELYLAWSYREAFGPLLRSVSSPRALREADSASEQSTVRVAA
jgi:hypothetical protein